MQRPYAILALLSWTVLLWPFPVPVFLAACLACVTVPLYRLFLNHLKQRYATALTALLLVLGIALPVTFVGLMVAPQAVNGLKILDGLKKSGWFQGPDALAILEYVDQWVQLVPGMQGGVRELTSEAANFVGASIRSLLTSSLGIAGGTLKLVLNAFIMLVLTMVGILYSSTFFHFIQVTTHFPAPVLDRFIAAIRNAIRAVLAGVLLVALLQGIVCALAFAVVGLPAPAFWGLMAAFMAPIPVVGTGVIWIPACIYVWFSISKAAALALLLCCGLCVIGSDNFLRPFLVRWGGIDAPFSVVLLAIICGIISLGPVGIIAGPVIAAFAMQAAREAEQGKRGSDSPYPW